MADLTVLAHTVRCSAQAMLIQGVAGELINPGEVVYFKPSDGRYYKAAANASATMRVAGIAANGSRAGFPIDICLDDPALSLTASPLTQGQIYILSSTAGKIAPHTDLAAGMFPALLLVATAANTAIFRPVIGEGAF